MWLAGEWNPSTFGPALRAPQGFDQHAPSWPAGAGVAATLRSDGSVSTVVLGGDGVFWRSGEWTPDADAGGATSPPARAPQNSGSFFVGGPLAASVRTIASIDTWTLGLDGRIWSGGTIQFGVAGGQAWSTPYALDNAATGQWGVGSGIGAVTRGGVVSLAVIGKDGAMWNAGTFSP
jgi:hypothetical protein